MMAGITGTAVNIVGRELMNNDEYSYKVNKKLLDGIEKCFNYVCEDCGKAYITDVPWDLKCLQCGDNYYKEII